MALTKSSTTKLILTNIEIKFPNAPLKKINEPTINKDVLIIGTNIAETMIATNSFLFLSKRCISPQTKPATDVFSKQTKTVPSGEIAKNAWADNNAKAPFIKPTKAPDNGPTRIPAKMIAISPKLILIPPITMEFEISVKIIVTADKIEV